MQFLAAFIMKGRMQAMMVASTLALLSIPFPPASMVSSAAVALVTLRRGAGEGLYVLICACLAAAILSALLLDSYQFALLYGAVLWIPVWLISIVLREGRQLIVAVEIAMLLGLLAVLGVYLWHPEPAALWRGVLELMLQPMLDANSEIPVEQVKQSAAMFAHFMTGIIAAGSVYGLLFGLVLARWWQATLYNPGGFRAEFLALRSRRWLAVVTLLLTAFALMTTAMAAEICWNLLLVLLVLYTFIGTAVLHSAFAGMKSRRFMVPFLYITLLAIPHVLVIVVLFGLLDAWLDLRNKFKSNGA